MSFALINEREKSSQVSSIVSNNKLGYVEKLPFKHLPPKERKKKKKSKKRVETVSSPKHVAPIIVVADESELDDEPMPITYSSDQSTRLLILKISLVPILKMMMLIISILLVLSMFLPMVI